MSITCIWDNPEKSVIRHIYQGSWEWKDLYRSMDEANAMMDTVDHKVRIIIDMRKSRIVPTNALAQIGHLRNMPRHVNNEQAILVGANMFIQRLYVLFSKTYPDMLAHFMMVATLEEAYAAFNPECAQALSERFKADG